jgi:hypothetical protein
MPDFEAKVNSGVTLQPWLDPPYGEQPSRLNPSPGYPHKRYVGTVGSAIEIWAYVDGTVKADSELDGRLFFPWSVEAPHPWAVGFSSPAGWSAKQSFVPQREGHYCIGIRRPAGGAMLIHIDAEAP